MLEGPAGGRDAARRAWSRELRATLALGIPLIAAQLAQIGINTTDTLMMGRLGADALAAGALGNTLLFLFIIVQIGLGVAAGTLVAQERGRRPQAVREPRRLVRQGFWATSAFTVFALAMLWHGEALLRLAGQDPAVARHAMDYIRPAMWALPFSGVFVVLRGFMLSLERTREVLLVTLGAIVVNAAVNWVLMFGKLGFPALGITGTGVATAVTNAFMLAALAVVLHADPTLRRYAVLGRFWRADWSRLLTIVRMGVPIALLLLAEVGTFAGSTALAGMVGTETLAAHAIALQITGVCFMVPLGLSQATNVRVGLAHGRGRGVALAGNVSLALGFGFALVAAAIMLAFPDALVAAFIDPAEAARTASLAASFLLIAALFQLADGGQVLLAAALRGTGDTAVPLALATIGFWLVGIPLAATLALGLVGAPWGGLGIWVGLGVGLTAASLLLGARWWLKARAPDVEEPG